MGKGTEKDTARETGDSGKKVAHAFHTAREDARKSGEIPSKEGCFIATAVYNTPDAPQIEILRKFRDKVLLESNIGRFFVQLYYRLGPPIASFVKRYSILRAMTKRVLTLIVFFLKK